MDFPISFLIALTLVGIFTTIYTTQVPKKDRGNKRGLFLLLTFRSLSSDSGFSLYWLPTSKKKLRLPRFFLAKSPYLGLLVVIKLTESLDGKSNHESKDFCADPATS